MKLLLSLFVVASATLSVSWAEEVKTPSYAFSYLEIKKSESTLKKQILSMAKWVPFLSDSRRHYAEIAHVVYAISIEASKSCIFSYEENYQTLVNQSAPVAISNPTAVIKNTNDFVNAFDAKTNSMQNLVKSSCFEEKLTRSGGVSELYCDPKIHQVVLSNPKKYKVEAELLLLAGESARLFNRLDDKFDQVSKSLDAHKFVIQGSKELRDLIFALARVLRFNSTNKVTC